MGAGGGKSRSAALGFQTNYFTKSTRRFGKNVQKAAGCEGSRVARVTAAISPSVAFPFFVDLRRPELLLNNTISLYLTTEPGITVGIW